MKKRIKFTLVIILLFILTACNSQSQKTIYKLDNNGIKSTITYYHEGDKINKTIIHTTVNYEESGLDPDILRSYMETINKQFDDIEGKVSKLKFNKKEFILDDTTDYKKLDFDKYEKIELPSMRDIEDEMSLKENEKLMEEQGYTKK